MNQYLYTVQVSRLGMLDNPTDEEQRIAQEHLAYMKNSRNSRDTVLRSRTFVRKPLPYVAVLFYSKDIIVGRSALRPYNE